MAYITVSKYAKLHGKTPQTIHACIKSGKLPAIRKGSRYYIEADTPYPQDKRITHGAYIGVRARIKKTQK
ncbi:MAG: helix-turn-helix domain-containing protein [Eubacteriales bacterium]|jgi:hypothetical protein|nr:hypothetical protein [Clostridiales bacterium]